ncbi:MAG: biotin/lipoyl-binding protein [Firmicutes bacterium]|nr:biotin/lipoyl-binding protein [Bacillota bacterium]
MSIYKVTIEGRTYEVTVEQVSKEETSNTSNQTVKQEQPVKTERAITQGTQVPAPLSGTILSVKVKTGDQVKKGSVLLTLEALKLENEIVAPVDGQVLEVVKEGQTVETGQSLAVIG